MGDQRSPKKAPASAAPPASSSGTPIPEAIETQMEPIVAAVPKDVPVMTETRQQSRKVMRTKRDGVARGTAYATIAGMTPAARQSPVRMPTVRSMPRMRRMGRMPCQHIASTSPGAWPERHAQPQKSASPTRRA